jgi:aminoglycoside phosphotransferase (APT) family kinase protein
MKMHTDEVNIDVPLVRQLLSEQFPSYAGLPIELVESTGTSNVIYRLGKDKCVRLPLIPSAADSVDKEYEWIPKLAPFISVPLPTPIEKGKANNNYPWSWTICKWLNGEIPIVGQLTNLTHLRLT